ncbi:hypothetical protein LNP05_11820 [Klebsiella pneumoniae subsp. pneumoniae]|nr:hypothetical protein [Klebsiella pneumoniae subsp. pneumoniae]MDQ6190839.1 hypothetical protein [Klebsiella pneumoniae]UNA34807.1 hypothetical protein LOF13_24910 [Klebsiella pneumoniae subsp. pneumoniae]
MLNLARRHYLQPDEDSAHAKINFREYLAVATALVIIVAFFHQWVLTF